MSTPCKQPMALVHTFGVPWGIGSMHGARLEWQLNEIATTQMASKLRCKRADARRKHLFSWRARACHRAACMIMALRAGLDCWQPHDAASSFSLSASHLHECVHACCRQAVELAPHDCRNGTRRQQVKPPPKGSPPRIQTLSSSYSVLIPFPATLPFPVAYES